MTGWVATALAWHAVSRLAYVGGVGLALKRQERDQVFTRARGVEAGFRRFRRMAAIVMNNDAVSFGVLCVATWQSLRLPVPAVVLVGTGLMLIAAGVSIKVWAARTLGSRAYYWYDFFAPEAARLPDSPGPYRLLRNPMYTVGYLHAYGVALVCGSVYGLGAAAFDQAGILIFHYFVERPHVRRVFGAAWDA